MSQISEAQATHINMGESNWKNLYRTAAVATSVSVFLMLLDIAASILFKETIVFGAFSAADWFAIFRDNCFSGLRNLGILNVFELLLAIPMLFAVYVTHRHVRKTIVASAVILSLIGTIVYVVNNAAVPMFVLSGKYAAATSDAQRTLLAAAGEAILARGEDFTPGAFAGFILGEIANLIIAFVMLRGRVFGRATAWIGLFGIGLLSVYTLWATFIPALLSLAMLVAMIGGTLSTVWYILIARKFVQLGRKSES